MDWTVFLLFFLASSGAAATGSMFPPGEWYDRLSKPSWTPPNWLFPVAWTLLYIASSVAAARVAVLEGSAHAMGFWAIQIAFNTLWSPVFFGLKRMRASLIVMGMLWLSVLGMLVSFFLLDALAGALILPYMAWVTVAGALNFSVYARNPETQPA